MNIKLTVKNQKVLMFMIVWIWNQNRSKDHLSHRGKKDNSWLFPYHNDTLESPATNSNWVVDRTTRHQSPVMSNALLHITSITKWFIIYIYIYIYIYINNTCKLRKQLNQHQFGNTRCKCSQHNQTECAAYKTLCLGGEHLQHPLSNWWRYFLDLLVLFLFACVFWSFSALSSLGHRTYIFILFARQHWIFTTI